VALKPETTVAYLDGELDMSTAMSHDPFGPLAKAGSDIIVNLSGVRYMGSAGQRALRELQRDATEAGGSVSLTDVPDLVSELLGAAGMLNQIAIVGEHT